MDTDKLTIPIVEGRNELGLTAFRITVNGAHLGTIYADILEWDAGKNFIVLYINEEPNNPQSIIGFVERVVCEKYFNNQMINSAEIHCKLI